MKLITHTGDTWRGVRTRKRKRGSLVAWLCWIIAILSGVAMVAARELAK